MLEYLRDNPLLPTKGGKGFNLPHDYRKISHLLEYIISAMQKQRTTGFGLDEAWGGGFEMLLRKDGVRLEKIDRILFHSYFWGEQENNAIWTRQFGKRYLQYYKGDDLIILSQARGERLQTNVVSPVDKAVSRTRKNSDIENVNPELICTQLIHEETGAERKMVFYNAFGHDLCGIGDLEGVGSSIRVNTDFLKSLIRYAEKSTPPPTPP